jgi:hypothetical protein
MGARLDVDRLGERRRAEALLLVERDLRTGGRDHLDAAELLPNVGEPDLGVATLIGARRRRLLEELLEVLRSLERMPRFRAALREIEEHGGVFLQGISLKERQSCVFELALVVGVHAFLEARARLHGDGVVLRRRGKRHGSRR